MATRWDTSVATPVGLRSLRGGGGVLSAAAAKRRRAAARRTHRVTSKNDTYRATASPSSTSAKEAWPLMRSTLRRKPKNLKPLDTMPSTVARACTAPVRSSWMAALA